MRVSAISMAFSRRTVAVIALLAVAGVLSGCSGLIKKTPDACSVSIAPRDITVPVNGTATVVATAFDCNGNSIAKRIPTFSSANSAIASVTPAGVIIGVAVGATKITAAASGKTSDATVTVSPERVATVTLTPATITLRKTNVQQFTAVAKNAIGTVIPGITFTWASSNSSILSIDNNGKGTALVVGNVAVSATADGQSGTASVTVTEVPIGACSLTPTNQTLLVNQQGALTVALKDTAGNALSSTGRSLSWASDNEITATVSSTGVITGRKAGTAKITATVPENTSVSCSANVTVADPKIKFATIQPIGAILRIGVPRQYTVTLLDSNSVQIPITGRIITWKNVTPTIGTVSASGVVTGIQIATGGRVAVDAEGVVDTVSYSVAKIPVVTVTVAPLSASVVESQTRQFTATVTDSAGNIVTDRTIEWISSDGTKATVNSSGLATALAAGQVNISANTEGKSGSGTLTITQAPVDTIQVVNTTFSLVKGTTSPFAITLRDAAGNQLRNRSITVTSDQPSVAVGVADANSTQINVTGVATGGATLTIQAVNASGQNQGKATKVVVTVTTP
jgi:uncharacterized protein YjdB